jgi:iron complex transport system substrate-binding protein
VKVAPADQGEARGFLFMVVSDLHNLVNSSSHLRGRQKRNSPRSFVLVAALAVHLAVGAAVSHARVVTDQTGRKVNVPENPQRLISLAPSITETIYALGLADRLVGVTDYCEYPPEAKLKPHVGALLNPSLEKIVSLKPDLVLGSPAANRRETADQLERLGIPLYGVTARTVDGTLASIEDLGRILGREKEAQRLVGDLRARLAFIDKSVADQPRPKVLYVVWYPPLITAGRKTFISDVIRRAGGISIADDLTREWPHLSLEEALSRDPDVILFSGAQSFTPGLDEFRRLPGWRDARAVKNNRLYSIPDSIIRPSAGLVNALEEVARCLHPSVMALPQGKVR